MSIFEYNYPLFYRKEIKYIVFKTYSPHNFFRNLILKYLDHS
jgi:ABC-type proline/glycine betaine transport system substrate-binding protein